MKHERYEEWLLLFSYGELSGDDLREFEQHLQSCSFCSEELEEIKQFNQILKKSERVQLNNTLLQEARQELSRSLTSEWKKRSMWNTISETIYDALIPRYKIALGSAVLIAVGVLIGYLTFGGTNVPLNQEPVIAKKQIEAMEPLSNDTRVSNVQFIKSDGVGGEVEFTFEAIMPVHVKGQVNDPNIQKVLASALLSDLNPGVRLQSVNALASDTRSSQPDAEVMDALISAVRFDRNPGVRKEALGALVQYAADQTVKKALLDVLMHDENSGLRIAAINALTKWDGKMIQKDTAFFELLQTKLITDKNNYIRLRSQAVLKEMVK
jgi:hypothetical protein